MSYAAAILTPSQDGTGIAGTDGPRELPTDVALQPCRLGGGGCAVAGNRAGCRGQPLELDLLREQVHHARLKLARALVGVGRMGEVPFLPGVIREVVELVFVGLRLGDRDRAAPAQSLIALSGHRPELLV